MRMKKNILYTLALLSIFASCAKTELPHFGGENDPDAVVISPSVAVLSSKSNPLGEDNEQLRSFNKGDIITIKDLSDNEVYTYKLTNGSWKSTNGKCLLWHSESLNIEASYGSKGEGDRGVEDQSDAEKIALADYMTYSGTVTRIDGNELSFTLERKQALVTVVIKSYGDQYNPDRDFISSLSICDLTPYIRDASGNYTSDRSNGTVGYRYSAIVPGGRQLRINYNVRGDRRIVTNPNGNFFCGAGNSYTINLRVGKDKIEVGDISVSDWGSTDWDNAEAKAYPYVTFSAASEQMFNMTFDSNFTLGTNEYFEYKVGKGEWTQFATSISNIPFGGSNGDLFLRGKSGNGTAIRTSGSKISFSNANVPVECTGDIRTLIDYDNYATVNTANARFWSLFEGCKQLTSAPDLPAMQLNDFCYSQMFKGCSALQSAPELPAMTLKTQCYFQMFYECTSLQSAPDLPATTLADECYYEMFYKCTALTTASELKATTLAKECYYSMFNGCTKLKSVTMLATDVSADLCLNKWLFNAGTDAASRTLTLENDDVYYTISASSNYLPDIWKRGQATINYKNITPYVTFSADSEQKFKIYFGIDFELGSGEYFEYSVGGGKWTSFTGTLENVTFGGSNGDLRLRGKSSKGTAIDDYYGCGTIRFHDASVPVYCTGDIRTLIDYEAYGTVSTADAKFCTLFYYNTMLRTAPELPATTLASQCYAYMFQGCSELTAAPVLPAEILAEKCYEYMFIGCTALSSVTMKAKDVSASGCLEGWLQDAGTSAASRTLTVASDAVYTAMVSKGYVPDLWKKADKVDVNGNGIGAEATGIPYVTFSAETEQRFSMDFSGFSSNFTLGEGEYFEYSVGGGNWVRFTGSVSDVAFGGSNGDLRLRGKSSKGTANDVYSYSNIKFSTADVMVKCTGDIRTLIDYTDYTGVGTSSAKFCSLFHLNTLLTTAPELPATDLKDGCYDSMFYGCTSLTEAPELPATKLVSDCYRYMFYNCSSLSKVTMLATEVSASNCLDNWLYNAGISATSRTLTVASKDAYNSIVGTLPDIWKQDAENTTVNFQNN